MRDVSILSWNINGLKKFSDEDLNSKLVSLNADIICFQETKITGLSESRLCICSDFYSYFSFTTQAYSGTATFVRKTLQCVAAQEGLSGLIGSNKSDRVVNLSPSDTGFSADEALRLDCEGRAVITDHSSFVLINVYCPFAHPMEPARYQFKMDYMRLLGSCVGKLQSMGRHVIVAGDINIAHCRIDHCHSESFKPEEFELLEHRIWFNDFLKGNFDIWGDPLAENHGSELILGFTDSFRAIHGQREDAYTCWDNYTRARETNFGTRIDYVLISKSLLRKSNIARIKNADIMPHVKGSDHCPTFAVLSLDFDSEIFLEDPENYSPPSLCSMYVISYTPKRQLSVGDFLKPSIGQSTVNDLLNVPGAVFVSNKKQKSTPKRTKNDVKNIITVDNLSPSWNCDVCTYINPAQFHVLSSVRLCSMCGSKQSNASAADDVAPTVEEITTETTGGLSKSIDSNSINDGKEVKAELHKVPSAFDLLKQAQKAVNIPLCKGHNLKCTTQIVLKSGPNYGRRFFCCPLAAGKVDNPQSQCKFFMWDESFKPLARLNASNNNKIST